MVTPVSFEIAKLLKEKEINILTKNYYSHAGELKEASIPLSNVNWAEIDNRACSAPTIAEVVMWLYEKHGIWIYVFRHVFNNEFYWHIDTSHEDEFTSDINFNSPTEAYEAGIQYTIENLL